MQQSPFHITGAIAAICDDMTRRVEELTHIDMAEVAVGYCQARKNVKHGLQASLTPLRFENGTTQKQIRGRLYRCQQVVAPTGQTCLYLLNVYLPRFQNLSYKEKLTTIVHELWHIGPHFDGDLRRHDGRCYVHGRSQAEYDAISAELAGRWLAANPPESLYSWLRLNFRQLQARHGAIVGDRYPAPKLVPIRAAS